MAQSWEEVVREIAERAHTALPDANGRIAKAVEIVLSGGVSQGEHGWVVQSQSDPQTAYGINGVCGCKDAPTAPHGGLCKHRLAVALYRRAQTALQDVQGAGHEVPELDAEPETTPQGLKPHWLVVIRGKRFIRYEGLLALAHERGLQSLKARLTMVTENLAVAEAEAVFVDGKTFGECADATPGNVNKGVSLHFARCALTRAKARALRDGLNIGMVALEELGAED